MTDIGATLARIEKRLERLERASRLSFASLDDTALEVRDDTGSLRGVFGQQGDGTTAALVVNGPPPPQPSAPIVASVLGGVTASWDGLFADGAVLPLDWSRTEVHASTVSGFTPDAVTLYSTIETAQGATVVIPADDPVYVRFLARSTSGTASAPSDQSGPFGPAPVVSTELLDGIVTTAKLADDAVTAAKVATGAIGTTEITDSAITTPKIVAGAVQTAQLDAEAVNASKIAAGAVTTLKLDALAVTSDKIAANAITVGQLAAGSVDATALKADAITGKTITGGIINGAEIHSDDGAGGLVDIENGNVIATGSNGWKMDINTTEYTPVLRILDSTGQDAGLVLGSGDDAFPNLRLASGLFADAGITDWRWVTSMGTTSSGNRVWTRRVRDSDLSIFRGGEVMADDDAARIAYVNSENAADDTFFTVSLGMAQLYAGRLAIQPPASEFSALYVAAAAGHTGNLIRAQLDLVNKFTVSTAGTVTAAGAVNAASASFTDDLTIAGTSQGRGYIAFQARDTATASVATEQVALTHTGAALRTGRAYRIEVRGLARNTLANSGVRVRVRKTNTAGATWLDTFTVPTPVASQNVQFSNEQIVINTTGATITTNLVMTYERVSTGDALLNAGAGCSIAFQVTDIGASGNFPTATNIT